MRSFGPGPHRVRMGLSMSGLDLVGWEVSTVGERGEALKDGW